ncbi:hypothetical protein [Ensifer sp. Root142]|uniref:hypothetical protein n=1 Tax=Ensifer sp. Root142 TaxID=1736461 RepID=UPI000B0FA6A2|nr:hypothetical protein [Ensifer sp. Root142]
MNLDVAKSDYQKVCELLDLASPEWCESYDTKNQRAEICTKDARTGEVMPIAHILPDCGYDDRRLMMRSPTYMRSLVFLLRHAFTEIRDLRQQLAARQPEAKKFAAECAMKCEEPAFLKFLEERHGLERPLTKDRAATKVRSILSISSRRQLDEEPAAAERWKHLRRDFDAWRRS